MQRKRKPAKSSVSRHGRGFCVRSVGRHKCVNERTQRTKHLSSQIHLLGFSSGAENPWSMLRPRHLLVAMFATGTHIVHRQAFLFHAKLLSKGGGRYVTCAVHSVPWELYRNENTIHKCTPVTASLENRSLPFKPDRL